MGYSEHEQEGSCGCSQLHTFVGHNDAIGVVSWDPNSPTRFLSGSSDRRMVVWDMARLGDNTKEKGGNEIVVKW